MATDSGTADISEFAHIEYENIDETSGIYRAVSIETGEEIGRILYQTALVDGFPIVRVQQLRTDPEWRGRGIGTALGERVHVDHPDHFLDLVGDENNTPAPEFWAKQKAIQPDWPVVINDDATFWGGDHQESVVETIYGEGAS